MVSKLGLYYFSKIQRFRLIDILVNMVIAN